MAVENVRDPIGIPIDPELNIPATIAGITGVPT